MGLDLHITAHNIEANASLYLEHYRKDSILCGVIFGEAWTSPEVVADCYVSTPLTAERIQAWANDSDDNRYNLWGTVCPSWWHNALTLIGLGWEVRASADW